MSIEDQSLIFSYVGIWICVNDTIIRLIPFLKLGQELRKFLEKNSHVTVSFVPVFPLKVFLTLKVFPLKVFLFILLTLYFIILPFSPISFILSLALALSLILLLSHSVPLGSGVPLDKQVLNFLKLKLSSELDALTLILYSLLAFILARQSPPINMTGLLH